jgi:hypothetical protein
VPTVPWGLCEVRRTRGKSKGTGKKSDNDGSRETPVEQPKTTASTTEPVDLAKVRENINKLVGASGEEIAISLIEAAKKGQLATAKYLLEVAALYPPTEETEAKPQEDSLAHTLLRRMGLPLEPAVQDENLAAGLTNAAKDADAAVEEKQNGMQKAAPPGTYHRQERAAGEDTVE